MTAFPLSSPVKRSRGMILLTLILLLAAVVRVWNIGHRSMWIDEYLSIGGSNSHFMAGFDLPSGEVIEHPPDYMSLSAAPPWYHIWTRASDEVHPPLYYLTLRIWRTLVPETDGWIRGLSLIMGLVSIVMMYICVRTQAGDGPALWAALLMALAGVQIDFSQETRSYTMTIAALLTACAGLLKIENLGFNWARGALLASGALIAGLTHYLSLPVLGVLALYSVIRLRGRERNGAMLSFVTAGILFTGLWGPFLIAQHGFLGTNWFSILTHWTVSGWLFNISDLPARFFVMVPNIPRQWLLIGVLFYIVPLFFLKKNRALLIWYMILTLGVAADAMGDFFRGGKMLDITRYTLAFSPGAYGVAALLLAHLPGWRRCVVPAVLTVSCALAIRGAYSRYKPDWRGMSQIIASNVTNQDVLIIQEVDGDYFFRSRCDYLSLNYYARSTRPAVMFLKAPASPAILDRIRSAHAAWYFNAHNEDKSTMIFPAAKTAFVAGLNEVGKLSRLELEPGAAAAAPAAGR